MNGDLIFFLNFLLSQLWWIAISVVVFAYLLAQHYMRKVFVRVEYHRKGLSSETHSCVEVGNRVMFKTGGKFALFGKSPQSMVTATVMAKPEIKVFGFKTLRLHHVLEGYNQTVNIRDLLLKSGISAIGGGYMAASEAAFSTAMEGLQKSIPKGKGEWIMTIMGIMMGLGIGFALGIVFG